MSRERSNHDGNIFHRIRHSISSAYQPPKRHSHQDQAHDQPTTTTKPPSYRPTAADDARHRTPSLDPSQIGYQYVHTEQNCPVPPFVGNPPLQRGDHKLHQLPSYPDAQGETEEAKKLKELRAMKAYFEAQREAAEKQRDPALVFRQM